MLRWLLATVLLAGGCIALVVFLAPQLPGGGLGRSESPEKAPRAGGGRAKDDESDDRASATVVVTSANDGTIRIVEIKGARGAGPAQPLIVQDARILAVERQEVPAERDGKLICLATEITPEEESTVPKERIFWQKFGVLAVEVPRSEEQSVPLQDRLYLDGFVYADKTRKMFRPCTEKEELTPGHLQVAYVTKKLRKLEVGDQVKAGQLMALINPVLALDEMAIKVAKLEAGEADVRAAGKTKLEAVRRVDSMTNQLRVAPKSVTADDYYGAKLQVARYEEEETAKHSLVRQTQRELSQALTTLRLHEIRASIDGVVKFTYKNKGDAVKSLEAVVQIQSPSLLRVEGLVEVQDAKHIKRRLDLLAESSRELIPAQRELILIQRELEGAKRAANQGRISEALRKQAIAEGKVAAAKKKMDRANAGLVVTVEASRPEPPLAVLRGHLLDVTCVAVSKGPQPWIVSGSEDQRVTLWRKSKAGDGWTEQFRLYHPSVVRAVACTAPKAASNKVLTGMADGRGTLFDLDDLKAESVSLDGRHSGAITCVAFGPDGKTCATGGEDRAICLWDVATGKRLHRIVSAHKQAVSSLQFASEKELVSAGRDRRMQVWNVGGEKPERAQELERRSGDVAVLGVSHDGKRVLFDEGRELRVLSLDGQRIEGSLQNGPGAVNFSTLALFAPDDATILTNGAAPGRLQLWRAPSARARASELRNFVWSSGQVTCGAFSPDGKFAVTGTTDHHVLVWEMPKAGEAEEPLKAQLHYVEEFLDSSLKKVPVRAQLNNPGWVIPGGTATMVIAPLAAR